MTRISYARARDFVALAVFAVWWGGLTFYSLVVVPIGSALFGSHEQGLITQQVTNRLNGLSLVALALLFCQVLNRRRLVLFLTWAIMLISALALLILHVRLDQALASEDDSMPGALSFYQWHRFYLLVTAVQWVAALVHLAGISMAGPNDHRMDILEP